MKISILLSIPLASIICVFIKKLINQLSQQMSVPRFIGRLSAKVFFLLLFCAPYLLLFSCSNGLFVSKSCIEVPVFSNTEALDTNNSLRLETSPCKFIKIYSEFHKDSIFIATTNEMLGYSSENRDNIYTHIICDSTDTVRLTCPKLGIYANIVWPKCYKSAAIELAACNQPCKHMYCFNVMFYDRLKVGWLINR